MLKPETDDMGKYLQMTDIIDFGHDLVRAAAEKLGTDVMKNAGVPVEYGMSEYTASEKYYKDAHGSFDGIPHRCMEMNTWHIQAALSRRQDTAKLHMSSRIRICEGCVPPFL